MCGGPSPHKRETGNAAMHSVRGKEKGSIHDGMEPDDRAEAQIESVQMDEGGGFAICSWISPREEGSVRSGVAIRWAEGGGFGRASPATVGI
jgi:hypothetical protein